MGILKRSTLEVKLTIVKTKRSLERLLTDPLETALNIIALIGDFTYTRIFFLKNKFEAV